MKLYGFPSAMSRSHRCEWMLAEAGLEWESIYLDFMSREQRSDEHRALNPSARVPVLVDGGLVVWESSAIVTYLGDKAPGAELIPQAGSRERALYNQWVSYATGELDAQIMLMGKYGFPHYLPELVPEVEVSEEVKATVVQVAQSEYVRFAKVVEEHLEGREFLLENFTGADIIMWWVLNAGDSRGLLVSLPSAKEYVERLAKRPKFPKPD